MQHSQLFIARLRSRCPFETPFSIASSNGTMNFAMPLGFVLTVPIGAAISALHALIMIHIPMGTSWLNYLHVSSMWTVAAFVAF